LEGKDRWGKGILINRLLLFLGLLGAMILMAGFLFSRGDRAINTAQAENRDGGRIETTNGNRTDSLLHSTSPTSSPQVTK
jgi:hypothetical protein